MRFWQKTHDLNHCKKGELHIIDFKPLDVATRNRLSDALKRNATNEIALLNSGKDTTFLGSEGDTEVSDQEVICAIKSVPCHY